MDRDDDMVITGKRHDFRIDYDVGYDDTGRVLAVDFMQMTRCGWAMDLSLPVADRAMLHADNAYLLDAVRITSHRLKTNTQSATAYRGFGGPQGVLGIERVMDEVAHALGMDAADVRRRNYYRAMGDVAGGPAPRPADSPRTFSGRDEGGRYRLARVSGVRRRPGRGGGRGREHDALRDEGGGFHPARDDGHLAGAL